MPHGMARRRKIRLPTRARLPRQISVRFSFNRDGQVVGQPLITYANPQPSEEGRATVRAALAQALARCAPLPLSDGSSLASFGDGLVGGSVRGLDLGDEGYQLDGVGDTA
jgi:hypothetical protein